MNLPLGELLRRVRGVVAGGAERPDKATAFLGARYARQRVASMQEAADEGGRPVAAAERAQAEELGKLSERLESVLAPAGTVSPVEAWQRRMAARELQRHAADRVGAVDGTHEARRHELVQTGRYAF